MDWIDEYKKAIKRGPKSWKYEEIANICYNLNQEFGYVKFAELGAGPLFLKKFINNNLIFKFFDKFCYDDSVEYFDIDDKNCYKKLNDFEVILLVGTLEYTKDIISTIEELRKLNKCIVLYITLPIFSLRLNSLLGRKWRKDMGVEWFIKKNRFLNLLRKNNFKITYNKTIARSYKNLISSSALVLFPDG